MPDRPVPGQLEERSEPITVDGRRIRGVIPFGVESRNMPGNWREVIEAGALRNADLSELVATVEHRGLPLGRHPGTLALEERSDGVHWSLDPPRSRQDVVEAVERGDLCAGSWRMKVARDSWRGDVRHVHEIAVLRDVALTANPAYPAAAVELRSQPEEATVPTTEAPEAPQTETLSEPRDPAPEARGAPESTPGSLRVEDRTAATPRRGLADEFRARGFPGETATMPWDEYEQRAVTWSAPVDAMQPVRRDGVPLGFDVRYCWPAFPRVGVGAGVTSIDVVQQTARALPPAANVVRAIDATTPKPEVGSELNIAHTALAQVAAIQSGIPNIHLQQPTVNTVVEQDLRLAINEALDKLILDALAAAAFQDPGADELIVSVRKCITTLRAEGYNPDVLLLTPAADELLDTLVSGIAGGVNDYVFAAGSFSPSSIFGLGRRVSKSVPAPVVVDSGALGRLYASPVSLAKFEADNGTTNTSNVRLELNAAFGLERITAAVRIAAA